jgi:hypothetical protein
MAEWIPLRGPLARKPTAVSWRPRAGHTEKVYDLVLITINGMELMHTLTPEEPMRWLDEIAQEYYTHWLEGSPDTVNT